MKKHFSTVIIDWVKQTETSIIFHDESVSCFINTTSGSQYTPNFQQFIYAGPVIVFYETCSWFYYQDPSSQAFFQLWVDVQTNEIVRIDYNNPSQQIEYTVTFMEMNIGAQDQNLFVINPIIQSICIQV